MFLFKLLLSLVLQIIVLGALLFVPAGTWHWWRAWVFLGVWFVVGLAATLSLYSGHREILQERFKPLLQKGQPPADKIVLPLLLAIFLGSFVFTPLDVFRFHLLAKPGPLVSFVGLVMFVWGFWLNYLALKENPFASPVVKHLEERNQRVIDTGVYAVVRHPMYAGAIPLFTGIPLWLESYAAAFLAGLIIVLLVVRIRIEEELLKRELPGYEAYMERVRYRLVPFLW